ncbi:MAG: flavodoxin family protein [Proteobacteria bacterium]|nr:flavodoxin family protein [Pseudomonadota bacterium]
MKILGISGSPRKEDKSGTHALVTTVLENTDIEYKMVSLRGKTVNGCIACLGCVKDNICKVDDDLTPLRQDILEADAYVFGAPNYYSGMNALTHAFMERFYQFRHQTADLLWGKLAVAVGVGGTAGQAPADDIEKFFMYNFIETVAKVDGQGAASCYSCGHGETCQVGIPAMLHGEGVKITPEMIPNVKKQVDVMASAAAAGKMLGKRLKNNHDRMKVAMGVKEKMMSLFEESA